MNTANIDKSPSVVNSDKLYLTSNDINKFAKCISDAPEDLWMRFGSQCYGDDGEIVIDGTSIFESIEDALVNVDTALNMIAGLTEAIEEVDEERATGESDEKIVCDGPR